MFPMIHSDKANHLEIFQIWLNLPAKSKMVEPHYGMLWREDIPVIEKKDVDGKSTEITIVTGDYLKTTAPKPTPNSWANNPKNEIRVWTIKMEAGATWTLPKANEKVNRTLFFYQGEAINVDGQEIKSYHSVTLNSDKDIKIIAGKTGADLLFLQGKPINEPVAKYGPFVMNTELEIQQAFIDYKQTQFGGWPWPNANQVHDKNSGRFAIHADGREERKG